ncbi:ThiF family adenylyltransferase [Candidatus Nanohalococcus occultus]|uniref:Molybdopterin-synthase adenylyltransferase n=1 Tax=Candidatus Nanohalococcus occultus TaxID=2978047 RepID=A0ABY8CIK6_9ARCH|nr:Molybdopterin-synthase adenylyltransferase [Candidatus Nanohaloarchaeota archaeon SVXNc]
MYSRFKALGNYGEDELEKLQDSTVAVIGLGATGSVIAEHLARHGVKLVLIDRDYLEPNDCYSSNLYTPKECEKHVPKAEAAAKKLGDHTQTESKVTSLNPENIGVLDGVDLIVDGTDNMETRLLINEYSKKNNVPWIYTAALGEKGYSMLFDENCFNCVFEDISPGTVGTCETDGILREVSTIAGSVSARKAVEYLTDKSPEQCLYGVHMDRKLEVESSGCEVCNRENFPHLESQSKVSSVCGKNKYEIRREIPASGFERIKQSGERIEENKYLVRAVINGKEFVAFRSGRAIIEAEDEGHAEELFAEVIGL